MNMTGTASQCKMNAESNPIDSRIILGKLFLMDLSLNFMANNGRLLTISQLNVIIIV